MKLYHYTNLLHLASILTDGLTCGDVPLDRTTGINAVNLTLRDTPPRGVLGKQDDSDSDKHRIRIAVEIDPQDAALLPWAEFPLWFSISPDFLQRLNAVCADGKPLRDWFLYLGTIPTARFVEVYDACLAFPYPPEYWPTLASGYKVLSRLPDGIRTLTVHEGIRPRRMEKAALRFPGLVRPLAKAA